MTSLDRKMLRDLLNMRGQALAIALVIGCGVATFVLSLSTLESLERTLDTYYDHHRFADVFAHVTRAPRRVEARIAEIPGVARVQVRVAEAVTLDMPGLDEPAVGRLLSVPARRRPALNDLYLRRGRYLEPGRRNEVLVSEAFAETHALDPGDSVSAVINGRYEELEIVGVALSPEFIYQIRAGDLLPDDERFGIFWMDRDELEAAFDMEGAFNDVSVRLARGASTDEVIERLDALLERYGCLGAYERKDQVSHQFVSNEIRELEAMTKVVPVVFLAVAAFLLNVVVTRLVGTQREQIAALKALGYGRAAIGLHFLKLVMLITLIGVVLGSVIGAWMGAGLTELYTQFFRFPAFEYHLRPGVLVLALGVSLAAAVAGTIGAVWNASRLPPAEAMRPQPPADFRPTVAERLGFQTVLSPALRMILRQLERRPVKALLSCVGISMAVSVLVLGNSMEDAIDHLMDTEFSVAQRQDATVLLHEPSSPAALAAIRQLPGVRRCEPFRAVAVRLRHEHRSRRVGIMGLPRDAELFRLIDMEGDRIEVPPEGLVISKKLAEILDVRAGDALTVEVVEGDRPVRRIPVAALLADFSGLAAYMSIGSANRLMREGDVLSGAHVSSDPGRAAVLYRELKETPFVASVTVKTAALESFEETMAEMMLRMKAINVIFAIIIAAGVVYNSARVSLSERSRELATLRVIGFTRAEISMIQLGELAVLTLIAIPGGLALGWALVQATARSFDTELFRIPAVVSTNTYGFAALVIVIATIGSGLIVRRLLDRLDLVGVLKTRE